MARGARAARHVTGRCTAMGYRLRPGLSFCFAGDYLIFLDLPADRYFALSPACDAAFRAVAQCTGSREATELLIGADILVCHEICEPLLACSTQPPHDSLLGGKPRSERSLLPTGLFALLRAQHDLAAKPLHHIVGPATMVQAEEALPEAARQLARRFNSSATLFGKDNACLVRSIALRRMLGARGISSTLIFGVKVGPFAAHCWVQHGALLLSDTLEAVAPFTPIRAL